MPPLVVLLEFLVRLLDSLHEDLASYPATSPRRCLLRYYEGFVAAHFRQAAVFHGIPLHTQPHLRCGGPLVLSQDMFGPLFANYALAAEELLSHHYPNNAPELAVLNGLSDVLQEIAERDVFYQHAIANGLAQEAADAAFVDEGLRAIFRWDSQHRAIAFLYVLGCPAMVPGTGGSHLSRFRHNILCPRLDELIAVWSGQHPEALNWPRLRHYLLMGRNDGAASSENDS